MREEELAEYLRKREAAANAGEGEIVEAEVAAEAVEATDTDFTPEAAISDESAPTE
ncbi:hypothetical protein D3C83_324030 [compost metagenome]